MNAPQTHRTGRIPGGPAALARRRRAAWARYAAVDADTDSNCDPGFGIAIPDCGDHAFGTPVADANDPGFYADGDAFGAPVDDGHANAFTHDRIDALSAPGYSDDEPDGSDSH